VSPRAGLWTLAAATAAAYAALIWTGVTQLLPEAGGQAPFDLRVMGYDVAEARAYLEALTDAGRRLWAGPVRWLDTVFPLLMGTLLAALIWRLGRPWLAPVPFVYTAADLWENARVREMIAAGPGGVTPAMVEGASAVTQGKFALLAMSVALLWAVWRRR
jgi:hypothetical protein